MARSATCERENGEEKKSADGTDTIEKRMKKKEDEGKKTRLEARWKLKLTSNRDVPEKLVGKFVATL